MSVPKATSTARSGRSTPRSSVSSTTSIGTVRCVSVLDANVPIHPSGGSSRICPLRPLDVVPFHADPGYLTEPTFGTQLDTLRAGQSWFNGNLMGLMDFGAGIVPEVDAEYGFEGLAETIPMFQFARVNSAGEVEMLAAPRVAGAGPLFSGTSAVVVTHAMTGWPQPRFGGYWRLHRAMLPATADAFRAAEHPVAEAAAAAATPPIDIKEYEGRVATNKACFDQDMFPGGCTWLDSQAKIEGTLGRATISATEITMSSHFVFYDKMPVKR